MSINTNGNLIIWQKWFDPFGSDDQPVETSFENDIVDQQDSENEEDDIDNFNNLTDRKLVRAIATPMGIIPYTENTACGKIFNFWVGHTNFSINKSIAKIIEDCDGVEALDIFTRYRFRIAIGKIFDAPKVMKQINDKVYEFLG